MSARRWSRTSRASDSGVVPERPRRLQDAEFSLATSGTLDATWGAMTSTRWGGVVLVAMSVSGCCFPDFFPEPRTRSPDAGDCFSVERQDIDFGEIDVDTTAISRINVTNRMPFEIVLAVNASAPFTAQPASMTLAPGAGQLLDVRATPTAPLPAASAVVLSDLGVVGGCTAQVTVSVHGGGRLTFDESVDFGMVDPGQSSDRVLRFTNTTSRALSVSGFGLPAGTPFSGAPTGSLVVPPQSAVDVPLRANVTANGVFTSTLSFLAPGGPRTVVLQVIGAHPVASLSSQRVDFERVGFFSSGVSFADRRVRLTNSGVSGAEANTQLRLMPPFFTVETVQGPAGAPELQLDSSQMSNPIAAGASAIIPLHFEPTQFGARQWRVTLFTNEPGRPSQTFDVVANVVGLPACSVTTTPLAQDGLVLTLTDGGSARGTITLRNTSAVDCIVDDVRLDESTPMDWFALEQGEVTQVTLPPGAAHAVLLRADPVALGRVRGELRYHVMAQGEPVRRVPFAATVR